MNQRFDAGTPPVREGDTLDVNIEAVGSKGDGIAKVQGFVLFVPGVNEGDEVKVKVTKVLRKVGFAEVIGDATGAAKGAEQAESEEAPEETAEEPAEAETTPESDEPEEGVQDTEDFGEDLEEEK